MRYFPLFLILLFGGCSSSTPGKVTLIVYSPHGKELLGEFEKRFEAQNPNVDVRWLDMGSQQALDRVRSERSNPQADIWWGAPSTMFSQAEKENLLEPFKPSWGDNVDKSANYRAALEQAKRFVEVVNKYGGKAEILMLRDAGLTGNTHIPFADMNNVAVADLLSEFLETEGLSARRK